MTFKINLALVIVVAISAFGNCIMDAHWSDFKKLHGKVYRNSEEESHRRLIWEENMKFINQHNKDYAEGRHSYKLGPNKFADLTNAEYRATILGGKQDIGTVVDHPQTILGHMNENPTVLPPSVDWRTKGCVGPVLDQNECGAYAFSAVGSIEGQHCRATGQFVGLSVQNVIDCSFAEGNQGCEAGTVDNVFIYVVKNKGIDTDASYPFEGKDGKCRFSKDHIGATISSYRDVRSGDEAGLQTAVANIGPVSAGIDASQPSFQFYVGGVYDEPKCSSTEIDHLALVVGYGILNGTDYWIVKNSWGTEWGMEGYILMSRNKNNQCAIATAASYAIA